MIVPALWILLGLIGRVAVSEGLGLDILSLHLLSSSSLKEQLYIVRLERRLGGNLSLHVLISHLRYRSYVAWQQASYLPLLLPIEQDYVLSP